METNHTQEQTVSNSETASKPEAKPTKAPNKWTHAGEDWLRLQTEMIAAVRDYATEHYADGAGWDYVVEAMDDEQLAEIIGTAFTAKGAIKKVKKVVAVHASRDSEAKAAADHELEAAGKPTAGEMLAAVEEQVQEAVKVTPKRGRKAA